MDPGRLVKIDDPNGDIDTNKLSEDLMTEVGKTCESGNLKGSKTSANPFEDFYGHRDIMISIMGPSRQHPHKG